jgi:hypothetical protein
MLLRFIISSGLADFWANRNFKLIVEAFSFHFKWLVWRLFSPVEHGNPSRYSIAVLDALPQYRAGLDSPPRKPSILRREVV